MCTSSFLSFLLLYLFPFSCCSPFTYYLTHLNSMPTLRVTFMLLVCKFNDALSDSHYSVKSRMTGRQLIINWKEFDGKKLSDLNGFYFICLEELRKTVSQFITRSLHTVHGKNEHGLGCVCLYVRPHISAIEKQTDLVKFNTNTSRCNFKVL